MTAPDDRPTVLIAEDEPRILRSLAFIVEHEGGRALQAADGHAALAAVADEQPVLAIIDLMMPGLDGLEVVRRLRANPATARLPIVVLTALGQAEHERQALAAGADRYLRKPFDARELRALIVAHLRPDG